MQPLNRRQMAWRAAQDLTDGMVVNLGMGMPVAVSDYVLEQAITGDLALVRADTADRYGNLTFRYAQANFGPVMATAAKLAVAEVRAMEDEPIEHTRVQLPGIYVDRILAVGDAR